ncbi:MAG: hypothetical protein ISS79_08265 [Phycisphaerae bacterium]|nr:hypothetical protein [Phycisphaerae bacterium]
MNPTDSTTNHLKIEHVGTWLLLGLILTIPVFVQAAGPYEIRWNTIGGGGRCSGGPYTLSGTIGQPDAAYSAGGGYELLGGFWPGGPLCFVTFDDFARFADCWLVGDMTGDLDSSGELNFSDLEWFSAFWLDYCPYDWQLR